MANDSEADLKKPLTMALSPLMEMLEAKKECLGPADWAVLVSGVASSVICAPDQYLKGEYASEVNLERLVGEIFQEFIAECTT